MAGPPQKAQSHRPGIYDERCAMRFGDAKSSVQTLIGSVKEKV
ncbi:MAG TPA: hypothetical protein VGO40_15405 [Longimicrobium sp.]|jgi:hypothetical protein|nr:hypothetical protein [Longimicrobium sp.]